MQTILGAGGTIGKDLAKELLHYTQDIRLVSRNPNKVNPNDQLFLADLTKPEEVRKAIAGSEVMYLTVGFDYNIKVWRTVWPTLMRAVIDACKAEGAKLVFFDNVYMYDPDYLGHMTEETPIRPVSRKGEVRAQLHNMIMDEVKAGKLKALIARSADFYGPHNDKSVLVETVVKNLAKGKKANWFVDAGKVHSYTYTPDAAKATAMLGNTEDAYNQVWHVPTSSEKLTGRQWIERFAAEFKAAPRYMVVSNFMLKLMGLFVPVMREFPEMNYQYDRDYFFDSSKFNKRFNFTPTPYREGIKKTAESYR